MSRKAKTRRAIVWAIEQAILGGLFVGGFLLFLKVTAIVMAYFGVL